MSIPYQFAPIPHSVLDAGVSAAAVGCYCQLLRHHSRGVVLMGLERLATKLGCCAKTAGKYVAELVQAGLLLVEEREGRASRYTITAWATPEPTPEKSSDVLDVLDPGSEEQPPEGRAVPIQSSRGSESDPQPEPEPKPTLLRRIENWGKGFKARAIARVQSDPPIRRAEQSNPEPVEPSGALAAAADAPRQAPPGEEQPEVAASPYSRAEAAVRATWEYIGDRTFRRRDDGKTTMTAEAIEAAEFWEWTFREEEWPLATT